jgi:HlyD family secretion protein
MRLPRLRFTIANLMVLIAIAGLALAVLVMRVQRNQRMAAMQVALAEYENAMLTREVAEIAVVEFNEGVFEQSVKENNDEIELAEMFLDYSVNFRGSDKRTLDDAKAMLQKAKKKKTGTVSYTSRMTIEQLQREVAKATAAEKAAKAAYDQLQAAVANSWW